MGMLNAFNKNLFCAFSLVANLLIYHIYIYDHFFSYHQKIINEKRNTSYEA